MSLDFQIIQKKLISFQYYLLILLTLLIPYWGFFEKFQHLSVLLFIFVLLSGLFNIQNIKKIFNDKIIISLSLFFLFLTFSILWSPQKEVTWEYWKNLHNYKYYFLLLFSIYSMKLSAQQIKKLLFIMAIAPFGTSIIYYLNALGITHIYSALFFHGNSNLLSHYLINNFFILYSASYFYLLFFEYLMKKEFKYMFLSLLTTLFFATSLIIDPLSIARLMILGYLIVLLTVPLFYLHKKHAIGIIILIILCSFLFISQNQKMQQGIQTITTAIENDKYTGSWGHRLGFAIVGMSIFKEHPIIGRGINDVRARTIEFAKENPKYFVKDPNRHFHNEHINFLVESGIVGYILFLFFIYMFLSLSIEDSFINKLKNTFIIYYLIIMLGEHYISTQQTGSFFFLFVGLILLFKQQKSISLQPSKEQLL